MAVECPGRMTSNLDEPFPFTKLFGKKLQEIKDVLDGKNELMNFDSVEDTNETDPKAIIDLIEKLKNSVLRLDLSNEMYKKFTAGQSEERTERVGNPNGGKHRWYDGTFYTCQECQATLYGAMAFRSHLQTDHQVHPNLLRDLLGFSSSHQEHYYTCLVCREEVDHEFKPLYDHFRRKHSMTMYQYEMEFEKKHKKNLPKGNPSRPTTRKKFEGREKLKDIQAEKHKNFDANDEDDKVEIESQKLLSVPPTVIKTEPQVSQNKTRYYCPFLQRETNCTFFTFKEGMRNGAAAAHLSQIHQIRNTDMKPGEYTFIRVKEEMS